MEAPQQDLDILKDAICQVGRREGGREGGRGGEGGEEGREERTCLQSFGGPYHL